MNFGPFEVSLPSILSFKDSGAAKTVTKKGGIEVGDTGTKILAGIISEEYNTKLQGTRGIAIFDEMRKSDGTVKAAVLACTLPIRSAAWYVKPASEDQADIEVAEFVRAALWEHMSFTFDDLMRHALISLPLGVMAFEKVYRVADVAGTQRVVLDLRPRMPQSITKWAIGSGDEPGISQDKSNGTPVEIPMDKLVVIVNDMEGMNWWGTSILRAAYKHWFIKNNFYKIDAIAFERQGLGIPKVKMPDQYTEQDRARAETVLKNIRANQQAFVIEPHDFTIEFMDMKGKTTRDPDNSITHHNREIMKSVLAQFLELGAASGSGSRAVSEDHSKLFLQSLETVARNVGAPLNKAIRELVDLNFDGIKRYPELTFTGITENDTQAIATAYQTLVTAGGIKVSVNDEKYFREMLGLPERDPDEEDEDEDEEEPEEREPEEDLPEEKEAQQNNSDLNKKLGVSRFDEALKKNVYPERAEVARAVSDAVDGLSLAEGIDLLKGHIGSLADAGSSHPRFYSVVKAEMTAKLNELRRKAFAEDNDFKGYRPLTFAEKKVNFKGLQQKLDELESQFTGETKDLLHAARDEYMRKLTKAAHDNDTQAIKDATMKAQGDYARILKNSMKNSFETGKASAAKELGVPAKANPRELLHQIDILSNAIAEQQIANITNDAKTAYVDALGKGVSTTVALAAADEAAKSAIDTLVSNTSQIVMAGYVNHGRGDVFDREAASMYALQRSELMDSRTCNYCLSLDGRVIEMNDAFGKNTIFHSNCRGIWVGILKDEEELPKIGGIPQSLRDRFGDVVNDLIQPKKAVTKKNTPARKEADRRDARK